jgi:hypothetical protein
MASVQGNPLPAALTGIGLAWLMASNARSPSGDAAASTASGTGKTRLSTGPSGLQWTGHDDLERRIRAAEQGVARQRGETEDAFRGRLEGARGEALGLARQAQDTAESFGQRVQEALAAARQSVTQGAHDLRDRASDAAGQLGSGAQNAGAQLAQGGQAARQMGNNLISTITDNPVLLGAVGLAVGALLGALVPQSEQEESALGGMAGQARDTARNLAQEVVDRGGQVAQRAIDAGRDSARAHGLTGDKSVGDLVEGVKRGGLAESVKQVAKDVLQAGDEAARKEGMEQDQPAASSPPNSTQAATQPGAGGPRPPGPA